jgi:hypothetical protein
LEVSDGQVSKFASVDIVVVEKGTGPVDGDDDDDDSEEDKGPGPLLFIFPAAAAVLLILIVVFFLLSRKKKGEEAAMEKETTEDETPPPVLEKGPVSPAPGIPEKDEEPVSEAAPPVSPPEPVKEEHPEDDILMPEDTGLDISLPEIEPSGVPTVDEVLKEEPEKVEYYSPSAKE